MSEFGVEQPIEDALEQQMSVVDEERPLDESTEADWEASEADVAEQRIEVPEDEP